MALSEAINAFSSSSDDGGGIVEITRVSGLLLNTIILLLVGSESMPKDMKTLIQKDPQQLNFLDPLSLPKLSHKQLYGDIDLTVMNKSAEFLAFTMQRAALVRMTSLSQCQPCRGNANDVEYVSLHNGARRYLSLWNRWFPYEVTYSPQLILCKVTVTKDEVYNWCACGEPTTQPWCDCSSNECLSRGYHPIVYISTQWPRAHVRLQTWWYEAPLRWDVRDVVGRQQLAVTERVVGCVGGNGDAEHVPMWLCCKEGFLYICGECDQISGWSA